MVSSKGKLDDTGAVKAECNEAALGDEIEAEALDDDGALKVRSHLRHICASGHHAHTACMNGYLWKSRVRHALSAFNRDFPTFLCP